ncbi:MAG: D-serine ammonia-lyase [Promethearchaeota archaeon]
MNEDTLINGIRLKDWREKIPLLDPLRNLNEVFWFNPQMYKFSFLKQNLGVNLEKIQEAQTIWNRFAPYFLLKFPETVETQGMIRSPLKELKNIPKNLFNIGNTQIRGKVLAKCDNNLAVAGSIKARGGIFEVLKIAESLLQEKWNFTKASDRKILTEPKFQAFFQKYTISVGSTGNLGYSIGISAKNLGFNTKIFMSADAKEWKKQKLKDLGVNVIEIEGNYNQAVRSAREDAEKNPMTFFIDDERSFDLFLGYATAALEIQLQLEELSILVDEEHPIFVYLPCGVGTSPGGISLGLKLIYGDNVHCIFTEPVQCPSMLIGLLSKKHHDISPEDFGISCKTIADGLACPYPSEFVGKIIENLITGIYTVAEEDFLGLQALLWKAEQIKIEPSSSGVLLGPIHLFQAEKFSQYLKNHWNEPFMDNATHIVWLSGGSHVPQKEWREEVEKGKETRIYKMCMRK